MRSVGVVSLAGGFAYGVAQGGGDVTSVHEGGFGRPLVELNLPGVDYRSDRVSAGGGTVDLQFGCPPCAGWSTASAGLDRQFSPEHEINDGIRLWFTHVELNLPWVACFESVLGCLKRGRPLWGPLARRLEDLGYRWCFVVYDNCDCGVPQRRERMLFYAWRTGGMLEPPNPLGMRQTTVMLGTAPSVSFALGENPWWAYQELTPDRTPVHRLFPYVVAGSNARRVPVEAYLEHYHEPGRREGWPSFTYRRLHPHRFAPAMMANALSSILHYDGDLQPTLESPNRQVRLISGRELAMLMGYPPTFRLNFTGMAEATAGERSKLSSWLTQAVSPAVGRWVAQTASLHLEGSRGTGWSEPGVWDLRDGSRSFSPVSAWDFGP